MSKCTTHHLACDCREAYFDELERENERLRLNAKKAQADCKVAEKERDQYRAMVGRVEKWTKDVDELTGLHRRFPAMFGKLDEILSTTPEVLATDVCDIYSDGTPGWYEVTACWGNGGNEMPLIGEEVDVIIIRRNGEGEGNG